MTDAPSRALLMAALQAAERVGSRIDPSELARVPKGFAPAADWDHLLRRKSLIVRTQDHLPQPDWLFSPDAPAQLAGIVRAHLPLIAWLLTGRGEK